MFDIDFRIRYYLGALSTYYMEHKNNDNSPVVYTYHKELLKDTYIPHHKEYVLNYPYLKKQDSHPHAGLAIYCREMCSMLEKAGITKDNQYISAKFGDNGTSASVLSFAKTRSLYERGIILLNLNKNQHWGEISTVKSHDIPFHSKKNSVVWRGASTGGAFTEGIKGLRDKLVRMYQQHPRQDIFNIRFSNISQEYQNNGYSYRLDNMSIQNQLKHKFIISIEGNDVATNLKWVMFSNSVVLMPPPRIVSWFMEDQLIPYVHYVPLKEDVSDVEEKYNWCMAHLTECEQIAKNGKAYVEQFLNTEREQEITKKVIQTYCKAVKIISK